MYSRYHPTPKKPIVLPKGYSGCAFSESKSEKATSLPNDSPRVEIGKPTPSVVQSTIPAPKPHGENSPPLPPPPSDPPATSHAEHTPPALQEIPILGKLMDPQKSFPFGHGLGFEELLLLGLILLLSHTEENSDVVLWLALLLFCG